MSTFSVLKKLLQKNKLQSQNKYGIYYYTAPLLWAVCLVKVKTEIL